MLKKFLSHSLWLGGSRVIGLVCGLVGSMFLARGLGPELRGVFALALLLPMTVRSFISLSFASGVVYYSAKAEADIRKIMSTAWIIQTGLLVIEFFCTLLIALFFRSVLVPGIDFKWILFASGALIVPELFSGQSVAILTGTQRFDVQGKVVMFSSMIIPLLYAVLFVTGHFTLPAVLFVLFISGLPQAIYFTGYLLKVYGVCVPDFRGIGLDMLKYGMICHFSNVMTFFNYRLDMFLVNGMSVKAQVGFYSSSVGLVEKLWLVSQVASTVLLPKIVKETSESARRYLTMHIAGIVLLLSSVAAAILWVVAPLLVRFLWGIDFLPAVPMLRFLLPGIVALAVGRVIASDLAARGKPHYNIICAGLALMVNIGSNIVLIPKMGGAGAAVATSISYMVGSISGILLYIYELKKHGCVSCSS